MRILIIPEDFRKDQYVLKPIIEAMMKSLGRSQARVRVCQDPLLGSIDQALNWGRIRDILERYQGMVDLFLLCVDRDGAPGRRMALEKLEAQAREYLKPSQMLLAENAWQEIEVWILAGHDLPAEWAWQDIRLELHPKELYYLPYAQQRGVANEPGEGRKTLAEQASRRYGRIRQLCPEDIANLENRIQAWLA